MLTEIYIEALLVDEGLADQVWERWDKGEISDFWAAWACRTYMPPLLEKLVALNSPRKVPPYLPIDACPYLIGSAIFH